MQRHAVMAIEVMIVMIVKVTITTVARGEKIANNFEIIFSFFNKFLKFANLFKNS